MTTLSNRLKELRRLLQAIYPTELGESASDFAKVLGASTPSYLAWENGTRGLSTRPETMNIFETFMSQRFPFCSENQFFHKVYWGILPPEEAVNYLGVAVTRPSPRSRRSEFEQPLGAKIVDAEKILAEDGSVLLPDRAEVAVKPIPGNLQGLDALGAGCFVTASERLVVISETFSGKKLVEVFESAAGDKRPLEAAEIVSLTSPEASGLKIVGRVDTVMLPGSYIGRLMRFK